MSEHVQIDYDFTRDLHAIKVTDDHGNTRGMTITSEALKDSAFAFARAAQRLGVAADKMASAFQALHATASSFGLREFSQDLEARARARSEGDPVARELWRRHDAGQREITLDELTEIEREHGLRMNWVYEYVGSAR